MSTEEPEIDLDVAFRTSIIAKAGEDVHVLIPSKADLHLLSHGEKMRRILAVMPATAFKTPDSSSLLIILKSLAIVQANIFSQ